MSRSNPRLRNPATRKFEWSGSKGELSWYDKELEENVQVKMPFEFMVLDQMSTITGWNARIKSQVWSNEVQSVGKNMLYVHTKQGPLESGLYSNLAATPKQGGKYTKVIYIAFQDAASQEWMIGKIMAVGSCLRSWIDFAGRHVVEEGKVTMTAGAAEDGISGQFFPPHFEWSASGQELNNQAIVLDTKLQQYLKAYLAIPRDEEGQEVAIDDVGSEDDPVGESGLDTPASRSQKAEPEKEYAGDPDPKPGQEDIVIEDIGDEPINLDDIPF